MDYWQFFSSTGQIDFYLKDKERKEEVEETDLIRPHDGDSISLQ